eukprot:3133786-Karenia_brevis.AAC.1
MVDASGNICCDRQSIADVFADFYAELFKMRGNPQNQQYELGQSFQHPPEPVTSKEVREQLKTMRCGKSPDQKGVVAELLKDA